MQEIIKESPSKEEQRLIDVSFAFVRCLPKENEETRSISLLGSCARMNDGEMLSLLKGLELMEKNMSCESFELDGAAMVAKRLRECAEVRGLFKGLDDGEMLG